MTIHRAQKLQEPSRALCARGAYPHGSEIALLDCLDVLRRVLRVHLKLPGLHLLRALAQLPPDVVDPGLVIINERQPQSLLKLLAGVEGPSPLIPLSGQRRRHPGQACHHVRTPATQTHQCHRL